MPYRDGNAPSTLVGKQFIYFDEHKTRHDGVDDWRVHNIHV